ncbi:DUF1254 domain-containing protein [Microbacterium sp. Ag1]|uniref:DUF1254 domain-containing protein n=1 Tax=Microbacterium sp. Ag1 TaxID=1643443 RepID=UPI000629C083|nr:DUF1254 domain-containing protein [Microbacterium sp. Ag1]KKX96623.1 ATP synthase subunit alpha [Microbacterium sp. Ag1]
MTEHAPHRDALAVTAYLYAFPLVFNLGQVRRSVQNGIGTMAATPLNAIAHARTLASADDDFVSINNDTVYSFAQIDLSAGPVRLHLPDAGDRYHVMQFVDAWTNNFAYVGTRATGGGAKDVVLRGPSTRSETQAVPDVIEIDAPTDVVSLVGRWAVDGDADLPAVHALQDAMSLTGVAGQGLPDAAPQGSEALDFWEQFRVWSRAFPGAARDRALEATLVELGITGEAPVGGLGETAVARLEDAFAEGSAALDAILQSGSAPVINGWQMTLHVFDYNLDFFQIGALDDPQWKAPEGLQRLALRAGSAKAGLWGNHGYEAAYIMTYVDDRGEQLTGERNYTLHLAPPPPVGAFWSVTMYSLPEFFLVDNPIDRYSLGDRTPGIVYGDDGSLTITMSHSAPEDSLARANWLPTPSGEFRPIIRMYIPGEAVLNGTYEPPAIVRTA